MQLNINNETSKRPNKCLQVLKKNVIQWIKEK